MSHNQNPVLKWSTQNHVNSEGGYPQLWLGLSLANLHLPKSVLIVALMISGVPTSGIRLRLESEY